MALAAGTLAGLALLGTFLGLRPLAALGPGLVPMSPMGALLVLLLVAILLSRQVWPDAAAVRRLARLLAALVALYCLNGLAGHAQGGTTAFEGWLLQRWPGLQLTSLLTDLSLLGAALALVGLGTAHGLSRKLRQAAALAALVPTLIGLVVLVSYAAGAPLMYGSGRTPMSLPAAGCALALGLALQLAAGWDTWPLVAFPSGATRDRGWQVFGLRIRGLGLFLGIGLLVLAGGSFYLRGQLQQVRAQAQEELKAISLLKARQIGAWYGERRGNAERIAHGALMQGQLRRFLAQGPQAPPEADIQAWMGALQQGTYRRVVLFDGQGRVRLSAPAEAAPTPADLDAEEVQTALAAKDVFIRDLHRHPGKADIHLSFWVPILAGAAKPGAAGALLLQVDPRQFLYPLVESWPTPSASAETLLVRREGEDVLFLNELRHQRSTALDLRQPLAATPEMPATKAVLGQEGLVEGTDYRKVPVLSVLSPIAGTDWRMVTKVDVAEVYAPIRLRVWAGTAGLLGLLALLAAGLGWLFRHHDAALLRQQLSLSLRYDVLMREANDIILLLDGEGRILEANARAVENYGYSLEELLGRPVLDLRERGTRAEARDRFERLKALGSTRFESVHVRKDGSTFPVEVSARALVLDGAPRVISFARDITQRRAQEREILRMTQLYSALSQVNQSIVWSPTREALFDRICEAMVVFGKFDMAWIALNDPLTGRVSVAAKEGDAKGYLDRIIVESGPTPFGAGPVGRAIREGQPCTMNDFLAEAAAAPWHALAEECGFKSMAAFPISLRGEVIGALAVYASEKDFFGAHEAALLVEAAMDISFALDHLAGEEQRLQAEAELQAHRRLLQEAQEAGGIGAYTWYIQEDRWVSSPYLNQIFGIGPDYARDLASWMGLVAPEFRAEMDAYVAGIIRRHEHFDLEYPILRHADGVRRWVHGQGDIRRDAEDRPLALVGVIQDITERKLTEQALHKVSVAMEQSPLSIVITDPAGTIEYVNPCFTRVTGYSAAEAIGQNPSMLKSPGTPPEYYRQMWEILAQGQVWMGEFENRKKNGELFHERATIAPVRDEAGRLVSYIAIKEDITAARQNEVERHAMEAQLQQAQRLESLGSLAGGVAHDMNNVLGAILGLASTLRESTDAFSPAAKTLDTIVSACMRGRGVVKSLLYFAKKDLQEERPIDLNDLLQEISQLLGHTTLKRIDLRLDLQEGLGLLRGDPGALSHALMNLCVNAMDAMPGGGTLHLRTAGDGQGGLTLSVRDTGTGMPPEVLAKAMEPFYTTKPLGKGTGLGLPMVYGTMLAHEGTFQLTSEPGQGTEAILWFPASRVAPRVPATDVTPALAAGPQASLRILLVDDDELIREAVAPLLEMMGHTVVSVPGGAQALEQLRSGLEVELVILDMNMPGMGGAEALPRILSLRPGLSVIMATGYSDHEIAPLLEGRPTVTSIRKPFSLKELQSKIASLMLMPEPKA
ncbi:MAG: PAS domain S-box protein [Holophagaceae bacterium]|uniref:histidine kinase n=1 Tax=Candidatus Geothrix skivensis TaxID=2954439 RepID=A0A9D7XLE1_9BACT|nr:PAS domain S-box protein [Candidatus Geothrix skivensis]